MNKFEEAIAAQKAKRTPEEEKRLRKGHSIGELIRAVFSIYTKEDALSFYEGYVKYLEKFPENKDKAGQIARSNIGWCFGEGMKPDLIRMWSEVCNASHPIFGRVMPTAEEAFSLGAKQDSLKEA